MRKNAAAAAFLGGIVAFESLRRAANYCRGRLPPAPSPGGEPLSPDKYLYNDKFYTTCPLCRDEMGDAAALTLCAEVLMSSGTWQVLPCGLWHEACFQQCTWV